MSEKEVICPIKKCKTKIMNYSKKGDVTTYMVYCPECSQTHQIEVKDEVE